jgi:hypothetical protein
MVFDSYYTIGRMHWYCDDYVFQGVEPFSHIILADGCSASTNSDLGARLLVLNARRELAQFAQFPEDEVERNAFHWRLGRQIVRRAARQVQDLGLDFSVLDATLLVAWCDGATVYIHLYGDGCIATQDVDGVLRVIHIEYAENAPYYLSYLLDTERRACYQEAVGDLAVAQSISYVSTTTGLSTDYKTFDNPLIFTFELASFPMVAVATDGLHSFVNAENGNRTDLLDVAQALLDFPSHEGAFVRDRIEKGLVEFSKRLIFNLDDLSLGVFVETH